MKRLIFLCVGLLAWAGGQAKVVDLVIDRGAVYQQIDNFGASDAWSPGAIVGKYWPVEKRNQIADWLFCSDVDDKGNPKGIGLTLWRVNIGAGSADHNDVPEVANLWNRTECFMDWSGRYDFTKQEGHQWFMEAARQRGVNNFLFFTNSAPYFMTRSGSTLSPKDKSMNLRSNQYEAFADFLVETSKHFIDRGYNVNYISPINEPQVAWCDNNNQEGTYATKSETYRLIKALDAAIEKKGIASEIVFGEAADMKYLFECDADTTMSDNLIEEFLHKEGIYSLRGLRHVHPCIAAHDYWSAFPVDVLVGTRQRIRKALEPLDGMKLWASEYCILEKNEETYNLNPATKGIDLALYLARIIHHDLAEANATAWQWWTAISQSVSEDVPINIRPYEHCSEASLRYDGTMRATKMMWATGNYSFFVRPGMHRIGISAKNPMPTEAAATSLMSSAYTDGDKVVAVCINYSTEPQDIKIKCNGYKKAKIYVTSATKNLEYCGEVKLSGATIPARSVVTLVMQKCD